MKIIAAQVIFSSILSFGGKKEARNRSVIHTNSWLWYQYEGFGFYDSGTFYEDYNLLRRDEIHLCRRGRAVFGSRPVGQPSELSFKLKVLGSEVQNGNAHVTAGK